MLVLLSTAVEIRSFFVCSYQIFVIVIPGLKQQHYYLIGIQEVTNAYVLFTDSFFYIYIKSGEWNQQCRRHRELNSQFILIAMQNGTSATHLIICRPRGH